MNKRETKLEAICNNAIISAISHFQEWKNIDGFYDILLSIEKTIPAEGNEARKIVVEINGKGYTIKTIYQHLKSKLNYDNFSKILFTNRSNIRVTIV